MPFATLVHKGKDVIVRKDRQAFMFYHEVSSSDVDKGLNHVATLCRSGASPQIRALDSDKANATLNALGMEVRLMHL